ncbi:MAG: hypothetical protein EKK64_08305 [Neisseriaceae bacterium]|nr:MAG: hypothetical protein EKK64_08305 [Neisseriaceae bacterium]
MKYLFLPLISLILLSCGSSQQSRYVCNCQQQEKLQNFVKESIKPANNMSDEEMEDVIQQLRIEGVKIYCKQQPVWINNNDGSIDWNKQPFDSCQNIMTTW